VLEYLLESGESDDPFVIQDATGQCIVDPEGAQIFTTRRDTWTNAGHRYVECTLLPRDRIYALGEFTTVNDTAEPNLGEDIGELLAGWKKNKPELLKSAFQNEFTTGLRKFQQIMEQAMERKAS
jgi:hypothetical protein